MEETKKENVSENIVLMNIKDTKLIRIFKKHGLSNNDRNLEKKILKELFEILNLPKLKQ